MIKNVKFQKMKKRWECYFEKELLKNLYKLTQII